MQVKVARVYLSEEAPLLNELFAFLHEKKIKGATVYRGVKGFGASGVTREARFLDMHFDLPMVLEFFDEPSIVDEILNTFQDRVNVGHVMHWLAEVN